MLRSLALALALLVPSLAAQQIPIYRFPPLQSFVGSKFTFFVEWEGRPALLLVGAGGHTFARFDAQFPPSQVPTPAFRLAAAFFSDSRPCAVEPWSMLGAGGPTSQVHLHSADMVHHMTFGYLEPNGTLTWMPGFGLGYRIAFDRFLYAGNPKTYEAGYRTAYSSVNYSNCPPPTGGVGAPELQALLLVYEGFGW